MKCVYSQHFQHLDGDEDNCLGLTHRTSGLDDDDATFMFVHEAPGLVLHSQFPHSCCTSCLHRKPLHQPHLSSSTHLSRDLLPSNAWRGFSSLNFSNCLSVCCF